MRRFGTINLFVGVMVAIPVMGSAQEYPYKPIRIVATEAGGGGDVVGRLIAQPLSLSLNQQVVIDNRPSGVIPGSIVAKSPPDGYTLLFPGSSLWIGPLMQDNVPYDAVRDFIPITLATTSPLLVIVNPSLPVSSVKELIALAKAKPGILNYSSGGLGSSTHLGPELFKAMAGVDIVRVPYKGGGPALNALMGGEVQMMIIPGTTAGPQLKSGRFKVLAVTGAQQSALYPGLPTVAASGVPGYEYDAVLGVLTTAGTPAAIIRRLNREIVRALHQPDVKQKLFNEGSEVVGSNPEEFAAKIKGEIARLGKVIKAQGIRAE